MTTLAALILLLTVHVAPPAPVDRSTTFSEVEPTPATPTPMSVHTAPTISEVTTDDSRARNLEALKTPPRDPIAADPTPMPIPLQFPPPAARPARPIRWRVDIVGDISGLLIRDPGWLAFDYNRRVNIPGLTLRADTRIGGSRVFLGGGASYRNFFGGDSLYDSSYTYSRVYEPLLFARLAVAAVEGIDLFAHVGGGPSIVALEVDSTQFAYQRSVVGMLDGQGGVAIYLPKKWLRRRGASRVTGGLELAAGYTWRGDVDVRPPVDTEEDPIPISSASLGDLSLRGFVWRLGLFIRFQ
jgi:hypothetical protein